MRNLGIKIKQLFLGMTTGLSLAIVSPISLAGAKSKARVDPILEIMPILVALAVSLAAITASITFLLGIMKLSNNMDGGIPAMEFSALTSGGGIVVALTSGWLNSRELNTVLLIASVINIIIFLVSFAWNSTKFIHNFLASRK